MQRGNCRGMRATSGSSLKGNAIGMESSFHAWQGCAVTILHPFVPIPLEVGAGLTDLDFQKATDANNRRYKRQALCP